MGKPPSPPGQEDKSKPDTPPGHGGTPPGQAGKPPEPIEPPVEPPVEPPTDPSLTPTPPIFIPPEPPVEPPVEPPIDPVEPPVEIVPPTSGRAAFITLGGQTHTFTQEGGDDLGAYVDPQGRFVQHCISATCDTLPGFTVFFRPDAAGGREEVVFELGHIWPTAPTDALGAYTAVITKDGAELATVSAPAHYYYSRWRWQSAPRQVTAAIADLMAQGLVPKYSSAVGRTWPSAARTYAGPMDLAGITPYMPQTGERDDIGIMTEPTGDYLCTGSTTALASIMAWLEASGTLPWHYRDENTAAPLDTFVYSHASTYDPYNGSPDPYIPLYGSGGDITCDIAHEPDLAYVPFLLTGDPYAIEELQFAATFNVVCQPATARCYNYYGALRAHAWGLRTMARCCIVTPDNVPQWLLPKSYFQQLMDGNRDYVSTNFATNQGDPYHSLSIMENADGAREEPPCPAETVISPWMEDFEAAILGHVIELGFEDWRPIYQWFMQNLVARCSPDSGWPPFHFTSYRFPVRLAADQPYATSWADAWAINLQIGYLPEPADPNTWGPTTDLSYPSYAGAALAQAKRQGIQGADTAHQFVQDGITRSIAANANTTIYAKWSIA